MNNWTFDWSSILRDVYCVDCKGLNDLKDFYMIFEVIGVNLQEMRCYICWRL
jgi:hypothetical protein